MENEHGSVVRHVQITRRFGQWTYSISRNTWVPNWTPTTPGSCSKHRYHTYREISDARAKALIAKLGQHLHTVALVGYSTVYAYYSLSQGV